MQSISATRLSQMQKLTKAYAKFSQSRSGLGNVLGGLVGLAVYYAGVLLGPGWITAVVTILLAFTWLVGKEIIRTRVYRSQGDARERWPKWRVVLQAALTAYVAVFAIAIWLFALKMGALAQPRIWIYLLFVAATPWIVWRCLRTWYEFFVGTFVLCACAVTSAGQAYGAGGDYSVIIILSFVMIAVGAWEHWRYRRMEDELCRYREV